MDLFGQRFSLVYAGFYQKEKAVKEKMALPAAFRYTASIYL
jgi:hypothetical protein